MSNFNSINDIFNAHDPEPSLYPKDYFEIPFGERKLRFYIINTIGGNYLLTYFLLKEKEHLPITKGDILLHNLVEVDECIIYFKKYFGN